MKKTVSFFLFLVLLCNSAVSLAQTEPEEINGKHKTAKLPVRFTAPGKGRRYDLREHQAPTCFARLHDRRSADGMFDQCRFARGIGRASEGSRPAVPAPGNRIKTSSAELRERSLIVLAHARQTRADAEAARLRAVQRRTRAETATSSAIAYIIVTKAATRRNADRLSGDLT